MDWPVQIGLPADEGLPISKLIVDVQEGVASGVTVEEVSDEKLLKNNIKAD